MGGCEDPGICDINHKYLVTHVEMGNIRPFEVYRNQLKRPQKYKVEILDDVDAPAPEEKPGPGWPDNPKCVKMDAYKVHNRIGDLGGYQNGGQIRVYLPETHQ